MVEPALIENRFWCLMRLQAFFLSYGLGCLVVSENDTVRMCTIYRLLPPPVTHAQTSGNAPIIGPSQSVTHLPNWTLFAGCCLIAVTNLYLTITLTVEFLCCLFKLWHLTLMPCPYCVCILSCVCHDLLPIKYISIYLSILLVTSKATAIVFSYVSYLQHSVFWKHLLPPSFR